MTSSYFSTGRNGAGVSGGGGGYRGEGSWDVVRAERSLIGQVQEELWEEVTKTSPRDKWKGTSSPLCHMAITISVSIKLTAMQAFLLAVSSRRRATVSVTYVLLLTTMFEAHNHLDCLCCSISFPSLELRSSNLSHLCTNWDPGRQGFLMSG